MNIEITARHLEVSDSKKEYVKNELRRLTKVFERITDVHVILDEAETPFVNVELVVNVPGKTLTVEEKSKDLTQATDRAVAKMVRQLQKYKEKW